MNAVLGERSFLLHRSSTQCACKQSSRGSPLHFWALCTASAASCAGRYRSFRDMPHGADGITEGGHVTAFSSQISPALCGVIGAWSHTARAGRECTRRSSPKSGFHHGSRKERPSLSGGMNTAERFTADCRRQKTQRVLPGDW